MEVEGELAVLNLFETISDAVINDDADQVEALLQNRDLFRFLVHNQAAVDQLFVNAAATNIIGLFVEMDLIASEQALELMNAMGQIEAMSPAEDRSNPYPEYTEEQKRCLEITTEGAEMALLTLGMRSAGLDCPEPRRFSVPSRL